MGSRTHPEPFLGRNPVAWRIHRETALLLGGPRALLLQLAHPLVAQGVADHSGFLEDPLGRLRATLDAMLGIVFGDERAARTIAAQIGSRHESVHGMLEEGTERYPAGTPYDATDPELLLWVHATLVDTTYRLYERLVTHLSDADRIGYYDESKRIALLLGVPASILPETLEDFERYVETTIARDLAVTPTAQKLADAVLHPPLGLPRFVGDLASVVTAELLPETLRQGYGLRWSPGREIWGARILTLLARARPLLPRLAREMPQARHALRSWRGSEVERTR